MEADVKRCPGCKLELPIGHFYRNAANPDGLQEECKECQRERKRERRLAGKEDRHTGESLPVVPASMAEAMRAALRTKNEKGGDPLVEEYRKLLKKSPGEFLRRMERAEAAAVVSQGKGVARKVASSEPVQMNEGTQRVLELLRELRGEGS